MATVKRTASASATWLLKRVGDMASALGRRSGRSLIDQKIIDGYLLIAKKTQGIPDKPGRAAHMQSAQVKNSIKLTALAMDLPAFLCLPGRYILPDGTFDPDKAYVQTLPAGRDSYLPRTLTVLLDAQTTPLVLAGPYKDIALGARAVTSNRVPTRLWGVGQPFEGVGCLYGYGAVYLTASSPRWCLTWTKPGDTFVYRLVALTPSTARYVTTNGEEALVPESPSSLASGWTLEIGSSVMAGFGAVPFTLFEGSDPTYGSGPGAGAEANWEQAQYPWFTFAKPKPFLSEDGVSGYKIVVAGQVVYEYGGPYPQTDEGSTNGWGETDTASPAGGRGLWVAEVQVLGGAATLLHQYKVYGGDDSDSRRQPLLIDHRDTGAIFPQRWYADNVMYKTSPATLASGQAIMATVSFIDRTPRPLDEPVQTPELWMFLDVHWFQDGLHRRQNITTTQLSRLVDAGEDSEGWYGAHLTAFNVGQDEGRFAVGAATDGNIVVMPVFSSFRPGQSPRLQVIVADKTSAVIGYSGTPGFAMVVGVGIDEQVDIQHVENPAAGEEKYWTFPAGDGQVSYIGNHKFMFYVSTQWSTPGDGQRNFVPEGDVGVAIYDATTGHVEIAGIVDARFGNSGLSSPVNPEGSTLVQVYFSRHLGRIEVVRPESEGYKPEDGDQPAIGNPATLIVTDGRGPAGLSLTSIDNSDIKSDGGTVISYDSGKTWTFIFTFGSPVGAFHCGNIAQARSEPVVRI